MKADLTRATFRPEQHFRAVRMQQGRVQLDAEWNEQQDILNRRIEVETKDTFGSSAGPLAAAGFEVTGNGAGVDISAGRYYVDGLLCENPSAVTLLTQPYLPPDGATLTSGIYLAYLEVWLRHISALEDPLIREVALGGPDTTTRDQLIWQVKLLKAGALGSSLSCLSDVADYTKLTTPPDGTLAARAEPSTPPKDPCLLAPEAGYRRLENLLYRVEVHDDGSVSGKLAYKWSRDNGSIESAVVRWLGEPTAEELEVASIGRDGRLAISAGCWLELIDDTHELQGKPGALIQVLKTEGNVVTVDLSTKNGSLDKTLYPKNPRVRRWDGWGEITPVSPNLNSGWLDIEDGIEVKFTPGKYRIGDFWLIPARTATADVEWPREANKPKFSAPHGVLRAFARLALLKLEAGVFTRLSDCRHTFPALSELQNLYYVGGDGQQATPNPLAPAPIVLASPLEVGVFNGEFPVPGAQVQFDASHGALPNGTRSQIVTTSADGVAKISWSVAPDTLNQTCTAALLEAGAKVSGKYDQIHFSAQLSRASEVAYDPALCADLKAAGVHTVQAALDALCGKSHGGCCTSVGHGGDFDTLDAALRALLEQGERDICLCLLVGDQTLAGDGRFEFPKDAHVMIHGAGGASRIQLTERALVFAGCASLTLRDFDVIAKSDDARLQVDSVAEVGIERVNVSGQTESTVSLLQFENTELVRLTDSTIRPFPSQVTKRFKQIATSVETLRQLEPIFEQAGLVTPIPSQLVKRFTLFTQAERVAFAEQLRQLDGANLQLSLAERDALESLRLAVISSTSSGRMRNALEGLREALAASEPGLAVSFLDPDGDVTLRGNRLNGLLTLYGESAGPVLDPAHFAELLKGLKVSVDAGGGSLRLWGNRIRQVRLSDAMFRQIESAAAGSVLRGSYQTFTLENNTLDSGGNQLLAFDLSVSGNSFAPREDVAVAVAAQGKYLANFSHNDVRLFAVGHTAEKFGNGNLNIVQV